MDGRAEMRSNAVATNAWLLSPSAAQKALAIFGSFRTAAAGLAGAFVFTVLRFPGNFFTSFSSGSLGVPGHARAHAAPPHHAAADSTHHAPRASPPGTIPRRYPHPNLVHFNT